MRPIDADKLLDDLYWEPSESISYNGIRRMINIQPTIDIETARYGKWVPVIDEYETMSILTCYKCSLCGRFEKEKELYCHCGAKMEGD